MIVYRTIGHLISSSIVPLNSKEKLVCFSFFDIHFQKLVCFSFFDIRTLTFFQVIMLRNLVWHANRSQISCSQCYISIFTLNQRIFFLNFEYQNRFSYFCFSFFDIRSLTFFFFVIMLINLVWHANRSQIS